MNQYDEEANPCEELIKQQEMVSNCILMKEGYHSQRKKFYFCTCDPDCQEPLCLNCLKICHSIHWGTKVLEDFQTDTRNALCRCGVRNHYLLEDNNRTEFIYQEHCLFMELSITSKSYVYYEKNQNEILCMFCYNCCSKPKENYERKVNKEKCKILSCSCKHSDYLVIFNKIDNLIRNDPFNFEGFTEIQFLNMVLLSQRSFENSFHKMLTSLNHLEEGLLYTQKKEFDFTIYTNNSPFMKSLEKINNILNVNKSLYSTTNVINLFPFIIECIERKFVYTNQDNIWLLKKYMFNLFHKTSFRKDFEPLPKLSVRDISNLNPFQRILYSDYLSINPTNLAKYFQVNNTTKKNYIDQLLQIIEKYKSIKLKNFHSYEILMKIYSQCKKLIRFNAFSSEQCMKFYSLNDEIIYNSISNKDIKLSSGLEQMKMLNHMVKCILYLAYYYNDSILKMYLNNEILISQVSFFHSNNETAKMIYKNCVHILLYCRTIQQICCVKVSNKALLERRSSSRQDSVFYDNRDVNIIKKIQKIHNKIMFIATDITALTLNYPDAYLFGLRRIINDKEEILYSYLINNLNLKEQNQLNEFNNLYNQLERIYQQFFVFEIGTEEIEKEVINVIKSFFSLIGQNDYKFKYPSNKYSDEEVCKLKDNATKRKSVLQTINIVVEKLNPNDIENLKTRILLNKTPLVFSLIKSLKIVLTVNSYQTNRGIEGGYFVSLFKFLFYYIEDNSDNCLTVLTETFLKCFLMLDNDTICYFISLLESAITIIMRDNIYLSQNNELMKVLEELVSRVSGKAEHIESFRSLLKLIWQLCKMSYLHQEHILNKIRKTMKNIYMKNPILKSFQALLLKCGRTHPVLSELVANNARIEEYKIQTLIELFTKFLKIINFLFDGNSTLNESDFIQMIFKKEQIPIILEDLSLYLPLRIELLKLFRIGYIDAMIDLTKLPQYVEIISNEVKNDNDQNASKFVFFQDLLKVKDEKLDMNIDTLVLNSELKNFSTVVNTSGSNNRKKILYYFEEGIILPLHVFLNKYMSIIYNLDGNQYIKLYEIVLHFLELKKYFIEQNQINFNLIMNEENVFKIISHSKQNKLSLILNKISDEEKTMLLDDIKALQNKNLEILNYKKLFSYFIKHANVFVSNPSSIFLKEVFSKKSKIYSEEEMLQKHKEYHQKGLIKSDYGKKCLAFILKYENDKTKLVDSSLSQNLAEKNVLYDATYRSIMLRPMFYLINSPTLYLKYRRQNLWQIFRLLQYDTKGNQDDIFALKKNEKDKITSELEKMIQIQKGVGLDDDDDNGEIPSNKPTVDLNYLIDLFIQNLLSIIFDSCNPSSTSKNEDYTIAYMTIKIMKYMCEDHNIRFQTVFFKEIKIHSKHGNSLNMFELLMCALNKILLLSQWSYVNDDTEDNSISYFYEIFFCMIEFAIEMVQGTTQSNLMRIIDSKKRKKDKSYFFLFLKSCRDIVLNNTNSSEIVYNVRLDILNFIAAFVEEKSTPEKIIDMLANLFNPVAIFDSIVITLKKLYLKVTKQEKTIKISDIELNQTICKLFIDKYFSVSEFSQYQEFELANRMFTYVKQLNNYNIKEAKNIIDSINLYTEEELTELRTKKYQKDGTEIKPQGDNVMIDPKYCQNYYAVKFFESITRTVWIKLEEQETQSVSFTLNPTVLFLSENTKTDFYRNVPRDSRSSKLFALMEYTQYFFIEINHNKNRFAGNIFLKVLNKINYRIIEILIFLLTIGINIAIFVTIDNSDKATNYERIYNYIYYPNIIEVVLNSLFLLFWLISKFSLYFVIETEKYYIRNRINREEKLGSFAYMKIIIFHTLLTKQEIISFCWNLIFSIVGLCSSKNLFVFSIQLFLAINLSVTLRNFLLAITLRYTQLLTSLMFLFVAVYVFSTIAFFLLSKDFVVELQGNHENACGSLLYCFFTHMEFGLRTDGGIGEFIKKLTFRENQAYFMGMFFYQFIFFVVIIVIMLAVIGGSIIDTFAELRESSQRDLRDMRDVCFICNATRDELEKQGEKFEDHISKIHNVWIYVDYMIGLKYVDPQETNAINSFVIDKIEEKKISWFPSFSSKNKEEEISKEK